MPPAYPFTARQLLGDLRSRLAKELGHPVGFRELGEWMGKSKSVAHFWFSVSKQPQLLGFFILLERLSLTETDAFIRVYRRALPTLASPRLAPIRSKLEELLRERQGLTVVTGGSEQDRMFVLMALGHSWACLFAKRRPPTGINIHSPTTLVPVTTVHYLDPALEKGRLQELSLALWPKVATSDSQLLLFHRLWSIVPELRHNLLRAAETKNIVIAESAVPDLSFWQNQMRASIRLVHLSTVRGGKTEINATFQK